MWIGAGGIDVTSVLQLIIIIVIMMMMVIFERHRGRRRKGRSRAHYGVTGAVSARTSTTKTTMREWQW